MPKTTAHSVIIENFAFVPAEIKIATGETVTWTSKDEDWHSATHRPSGGGPGLFDSPNMVLGDPPFSYTFGTAGDYPYFCRNHGHMTGLIKVI